VSSSLLDLSTLWPKSYIIGVATDKPTSRRHGLASYASCRNLPTPTAPSPCHPKTKEIDDEKDAMYEGNEDLLGRENVVQRLKSRIRDARAKGFIVRQELMGEHQPTWCEVKGRKILFLDASQPAREQLASLDEAMATYHPA